MLVKEIKQKDYDQYLKELESYSFLQTSAMEKALESNKRDTRLLGLVDDGKILAIGLGFIRPFHGGKRIDFMVGASSKNIENEYKFYDLLKDYAEKEGYLKLVVKLDENYQKISQDGEEESKKDRSFFEKMKDIGYIENDGTVPEYDGSPDFQFVKNLEEFYPDDYKGLLKSFNKNAQRKIKKAKELDINVRAIGYDEIEDFKKLTYETGKRQGFGDKSIDYYQTFYKEFGENAEFLTSEINFDNSIKSIEKIIENTNNSPKNKQRIDSLKNDISMLEDLKKDAKDDTVPLANMIIVYGKNEAVYFLGGSLTKYQKLPGAFILQYQAMINSMKRGFKTYNFFGIDGVFDGSDGVLRFKQNFNGYIIRKTGAFIYYPKNDKKNAN